jgi:hypothetical protein
MRNSLLLLTFVVLSGQQSFVQAKIRGASFSKDLMARERFRNIRRELESRRLMQSISDGGGAGNTQRGMGQTQQHMIRPGDETDVVATTAPASAPDTAAPAVPETPAPIVPITSAPVVPATPAPIVPETPAPVVSATPAPVVNTEAPVTAAPVALVTAEPTTPQPFINLILKPTFMPTPPPIDTGRACPTPDSLPWQALADSSPLLQSCDVDSDCADYFPEDGPSCCSWPFCVCATVYPGHDTEFKCVNY